MQLVKPKTKHNPTLTSDIYSYSEVLYISVVHKCCTYTHMCSTQQPISPIQPFKKAKICEQIKTKGRKGCIADKALADT